MIYGDNVQNLNDDYKVTYDPAFFLLFTHILLVLLTSMFMLWRRIINDQVKKKLKEHRELRTTRNNDSSGGSANAFGIRTNVLITGFNGAAREETDVAGSKGHG